MSGEQQQPIIIMPFNPDWNRQFGIEKARVQEALGQRLASIEHTGSTSIPDQAAKPVIDMFAAVRPFGEASLYGDLLEVLGYRFAETGMTGRYLFVKGTGGIRTHHLHILPFEGFHERNELLFRDYLRAHPHFVQEYGELKRRLAERYPSDAEQYTRAKTAFIQRVVDLARLERGLSPEKVWED
ncbi:GrpB family protein [Paenibacillus harenae]|uniref:GrpB family protein n=1 Tax=Paenibacillus harenae TaxID=306543 RepID=UPI00048B23EF|nr:GrpB family protein [Paenibacillus harenae]